MTGAAIALWAGQVHAGESADRQPIIVTAPGGGMDSDDALHLSGKDVVRTGRPDLLGALTRTIAGITLQDAQGNSWQPNLVYRGFTASPLQGQAQGLAVYLDGARFNQPFGDTVAFDLLPDAAIHSVTLFDSSAVYGLNALGGAMVMDTKTGASDPGLEASLSGGRFGTREASVAGGFARGDTSIFDISAFGAFQYRHEDGWRAHSPSTLYNGYLDLGFDTAGGGLRLKAIGADTDLTGNGVAPVDLLAVNRRAVFTWLDDAIAHYGRVSLHPWVAIGQATRIEGTFYAQQLKLRSVNGDAADMEGCGDGLLCLETLDGKEDSILTDMQGHAIADSLGGRGYGVLNRSRMDSRAMGALIQIIDRRALPGGENHLALGMSHDASRTRFGTSVELGALTQDRGVAGLGPLIAQPDGSTGPVGLVATASYWGLFAQDRLPLTGRLSAEIGLRYNRARIDMRDLIGTALNGRHRFDRVNPGIEFDYAVTEGVSLRAGYAESNRAPTPAELSCADENAPCSLANFFIADPPLKQVVARSWEAGASGRSQWHGFRIEWLLSAYRTRNDNDIQHVASAIRGRAYFRNIGATRRQGLEFSLKGVKGGFTGIFSYALTDASFRHDLALSSPANPAANGAGVIFVRPGDRLPGIPRHSATLSLDYAGRGWSVGGDVVARSGQYLAGDEGNDNAPLKGYVLVNLRAGVDIMPGVTLFGEVRNAFDRRYATFGTFADVGKVAMAEAPDASNPRAYGPGAPRRYHAGVKTRF
ncbi:TonB-dependent receptor [Sphingobium sp. Sx8-8]|uniref:TonB-dependent receptor n=1 Tax=Sphingobium sp. Sx8-8 TaxID=2933617 RepID=UPI001F597B50|nr:TonB-dependent receptor [Sphingobium sp. Sx8-8]